MIRNSQKKTTLGLVPGLSLNINPIAQPSGTARILVNYFHDRGRFTRRPSNPFFTAMHSGHPAFTNDSIERSINFRYTRSNAPENDLIMFTTNGSVYRRQSGWCQPIFPGTTSHSALAKPAMAWPLSNRLFFSDGTSAYVYDGRSVRTWGLARTTTAPAFTAQNLGGSIVAATGVKGAITWVILDEEGARVHESSRTNLTSFVVIGGADDAVQFDITALTPPAHATHWSAYLSELDGSEVLRRVATERVTTLTKNITAFPAATSAKAPERNDPPPPSRVGCVAKNRIFMRDEADRSKYWWSALGEVKGLSNGAADESFPGYGTNSISDLVNSDTVPQGEIRAIVEHENNIYIFTESRGYVLVGEMNLPDNRAPRNLVKLQIFTEGCVGPNAAVSTPYGLVFLSPTRRMWLWDGNALRDIGAPIQSLLDLLANPLLDADLFDAVRMMWYSGNGKQWLLLSCFSSDTHDLTSGGTTTFAATIYVYDFGLSTDNQAGSWFEWRAVSGSDVTIGGRAIGTFQDNNGKVYLLAYGSTVTKKGMVNLDLFGVPAHLGYTAIIGTTYTGSTIQTTPQSDIRTGLIAPNGDYWANGHYLQLMTAAYSWDNTFSSTAYTEPTLGCLVDVEDVDNPGSFATITLDTATSSNDKRAWLVPQTSGNTNIGGAFGKHFIFQARWSASESEDIDTDGSRTTPLIYSINKMAFAFTPLGDTNR